jgi:dinuclear metal center YbgI/SA1388 family protein
MGRTVGEITAWMADWADPAWAESYDNCGLLIGHEQQQVDTIVTALDITEQVVDYAISVGAQMIVSHHPLIFRPIKSIVDDNRDGKRLLKIIENRLAICAAHTNMDAALGGTNDIAAERLGLLHVKPLCPIDEEGGVGMGRIGVLPRSMNVRDFALFVKEAFETDSVRLISSNPHKLVYRVALCTGKGMDFFKDAVRQDADVYLTGDVTYHEAEAALAGNVSIVDAGHYATELPIAEAIAQFLQQEDESLQVFPFGGNRDPFVTL